MTDICEFRELNNAIVAKDTTEFTLPNGSITVTDSDGTRIPFSVERHYNALVYRHMNDSGELLLKQFSTDDIYEVFFELLPDKSKQYNVVFSGGPLSEHDGDEFTFSIAGVVGDYAVSVASFEPESDLYHGLEVKKYDVRINDSNTGFVLRPLLKEPTTAWFNIAWVECGEFPEGAVAAVECWVN